MNIVSTRGRAEHGYACLDELSIVQALKSRSGPGSVLSPERILGNRVRRTDPPP